MGDALSGQRLDALAELVRIHRLSLFTYVLWHFGVPLRKAQREFFQNLECSCANGANLAEAWRQNRRSEIGSMSICQVRLLAVVIRLALAEGRRSTENVIGRGGRFVQRSRACLQGQVTALGQGASFGGAGNSGDRHLCK